MTRRFNVTPKTTEQHLIVRSNKSVTYVTNNKNCARRFVLFCTNYWQTRITARLLCDSRVTCYIFRRTLLHYVHLMARAVQLLSVVCLSSVTLLHLGRDLNFLAISLHRIIAQGLGQFVSKFWTNIRRGSRGSYKLNTKGYEKLVFSTNISLYFENGTWYGHSCNGRRVIYRVVPFQTTFNDIKSPVVHIQGTQQYEYYNGNPETIELILPPGGVRRRGANAPPRPPASRLQTKSYTPIIITNQNVTYSRWHTNRVMCMVLIVARWRWSTRPHIETVSRPCSTLIRRAPRTARRPGSPSRCRKHRRASPSTPSKTISRPHTVLSLTRRRGDELRCRERDVLETTVYIILVPRQFLRDRNTVTDSRAPHKPILQNGACRVSRA